MNYILCAFWLQRHGRNILLKTFNKYSISIYNLAMFIFLHLIRYLQIRVNVYCNGNQVYQIYRNYRMWYDFAEIFSDSLEGRQLKKYQGNNHVLSIIYFSYIIYIRLLGDSFENVCRQIWHFSCLMASSILLKLKIEKIYLLFHLSIYLKSKMVQLMVWLK
jgi:hypothetical protein